MASAKIFRINYKSDFILTLESDAGWMTPFCIKFWTGAPSQAYYVGWDGETYNHCSFDPSEPTKLLVQFDDHHLPIGDLKYQVAYHFTVDDFPNDTEDEVINPASITTEIDGETYQVMLDFTGETAPEIQFALPAYANEAQRIANEQQRIAAETQRIDNEETRIANEQTRINQEQTRQQNEQQRINQEQARVNEYATLKADAVAATGAANDAAALANQKAQLAADKAALAQDAANLANAKAQLAADKAALAASAAQLANDKAALAQQKAEYAQTQGGYAKDQGDYAKDKGDICAADHLIAVADHGIAVDDHTQAGNDHTRAESDHGIAVDDHTQAGNDHTRAESDHGIAVNDHTQAGNDHTTAQSDHTIASNDHTQAGNDHTRAESDHTRAESDHAAVEVYVDSLGAFDISAYHATGGVLAKYADLSAALGTNGANIPDTLRKGGMSVKFVLTSDNKYVKFFCTDDEFTTDVTKWQGIDTTPTPGSTNIQESGGVWLIETATKLEIGDLVELGKFVNSGGALQEGNSVLLKIPQGSHIVILLSQNQPIYRTYLKEFNGLDDFEFATGYSGSSASYGNPKTEDAPSDANYLWFSANYFEYITSIKINNEERLNKALSDRINIIFSEFSSYGGIITPASTITTPSSNKFYIGAAGTYTNITGSPVIPSGSVILYVYANGSWSYSKLTIVELINNLTDGGIEKALSAEQGKVLSKLISDITGNKVYSDYFINSGGEWATVTGGSYMFPVQNNSQVDVTKTGVVHYTFLKSYTGFGGNNTLEYATGYTAGYVATAGGAGKVTLVAPADANYIYVRNENTFTGLTVDGVDTFNKNIFKLFIDLYNIVEEYKNRFIDTAEEQSFTDIQKEQATKNIGLGETKEIVNKAFRMDYWDLSKLGEFSEKTVFDVNTDLGYATNNNFFTVKNIPIPDGFTEIYFLCSAYETTYEATGYNNAYAARSIRFKDSNGGLVENNYQNSRSPYSIPPNAAFFEMCCPNSDSYFATIRAENDQVNRLVFKTMPFEIKGEGGVDIEMDDFTFNISSYIRDAKVFKMYPKTKLPVVAFSFDDCTPTDDLIVSLFDEYNLTCGFAYISDYRTEDVKKKYLKRQARGYQIMHHGSRAITGSASSKPLTTDNYTYAQAMDAILTSLYSLMDDGFVVNSWVTPDGVFAEEFQPIIELSHAYCFPSTNQVTNNERNSDLAHLMRTRLQDKTLAQIKAVIDDAITNDRLVVFYAHSAALIDGGSTDEFSIAQIRATIEYCLEKRDEGQLYVCGVDEAVKYYYGI